MNVCEMVKYKIIVDEREKGLWEALLPLAATLSSSFTLSKQVLNLGDVIIQREEDLVPLIIIERKCISDLLASIQDGRYKEQSMRLLHASGIEPHNIIYLIEGTIGGIPVAQRQKVYSAMTSILMIKRMSVLRTWSLQETAELIARMVDKMFREGSKKSIVSTDNIIPTTVATVIPTTLTAIRKNNITSENIGEILLVQIPGISNITAKAILDTYENSFSKVLNAIKTNDPILDNIQYQTGDGKMRRISKGIVVKLKELF